MAVSWLGVERVTIAVEMEEAALSLIWKLASQANFWKTVLDGVCALYQWSFCKPDAFAAGRDKPLMYYSG
jgi:hypothetical protein